MTRTLRQKKRIALIGAGASGLAAAKELIESFRSGGSAFDLELVVFEARDKIGGVWLEDQEAGEYILKFDEDGNARSLPAQGGLKPSPIYSGLRTNIPKNLMAYRNYPFNLEDDSTLFPRADTIYQYLEDFAKHHNIPTYTRFNTVVTRVYKTDPSDSSSTSQSPNTTGTGDWVVESRSVRSIEVEDESQDINRNPRERVERFDHVCVANGHYEKVMIPKIPGLDRFSGKALHARWYRFPEEYVGKRVMVIGSFASGSDLTRELGSLLLPTSSLPLPMRQARERNAHRYPPDGTVDKSRTKIYQSSSGLPNMFTGGLPKEAQPWLDHIEQKTLISHVDEPEEEGGTSVIHFKDGSTVDDIDVLIFATGYLFYYPFFKSADYPWNQKEGRLCSDEIREVDVLDEKDGWEKGGVQGMTQEGMDELKLFLKADRSLAIMGLPYLVVPFPLAEVQAHLVALTWSGRLPDLPAKFDPPVKAEEGDDPAPLRPIEQKPTTQFNGQNGHSKDASDDTPPFTPHSDTSTEDDTAPPAPKPKGKRYTEQVRGSYVFGYPFEFKYHNYILSLTRSADGGEDGGWGSVEEWRYPLRENKALRTEILGY